MKRLFLVLMLAVVLFIPAAAFAVSNVTFVWEPRPEADLAGYRIYQSASSGDYAFGSDYATATILAGTETVTLQVEDGTWYWVLTAFDTSGNEGQPSAEVIVTLDSEAPGAPEGFTITVIIKIEQQ